MSEITGRHLDAMDKVANGADVYSLMLAKLLREVEQLHPDWIHITEPKMYRGDGTDRMPYFGAILTPEGMAQLQETH